MAKFDHNPDFQFDMNTFDNLAKAFVDFGVTIRAAVESIAGVLVIPHWLLEDRRSIQQRLDEDGWQSIDSHELSPEDRWVYQKWVWSAPKRWWSRFQNWMEEL